MFDKSALIAQVRGLALEFGDFTLASGKKAAFYLDCRRLTLDSAGVSLVAEAMLDVLGDPLPDAVGGLAIGADPITAALLVTAHRRGKKLKGFIVRKEAKQHGKGRDVEGPVQPGEAAVLVEDVVTTGGSALQALEKVRAFGLRVQGVIAIVDRGEGGAAAFAAEGLWFKPLLTLDDVLK